MACRSDLHPTPSHLWYVANFFMLELTAYCSPAVMLSRDKKSNKPLVTALVLEFVSRNIRRVPSTSGSLERLEYAQRDKDIIWYLLRGSIWKTWTRQAAFIQHSELHLFTFCLSIDPSWSHLRTEQPEYPCSTYSVLSCRTGYPSLTSITIVSVCSMLSQ